MKSLTFIIFPVEKLKFSNPMRDSILIHVTLIFSQEVEFFRKFLDLFQLVFLLFVFHFWLFFGLGHVVELLGLLVEVL